MKKQELGISIVLIALLSVSAFISAASAAPTVYNLESSKFAVAQWDVLTGTPTPTRSHIINALVYMDNNGKNGLLVVTIKHYIQNKAVSTASGPVEFKWSMDHVTVEATLYFDSTVAMFKGDHTVKISWQTTGATSHNVITPSTNGLTANLNDCGWKAGSAQFVLDPDATGTVRHQNDIYSTNWAYIGKGDATVSITP
jgi:hypothetical protein